MAPTNKFLPDAASVKKAASHLSKLPKGLQTVMRARLLARAKELGVTLNLSVTDSAIDLAVPQAHRDACKAAGLTFPGTDAFPLGDANGKFSREMAAKAVHMVGLASYSQRDAIRKWLIAKLDANHASDLIPDAWESNRPGLVANLSVTDDDDTTYPYAPTGDELGDVVKQVRGIRALQKSGRTAQARSATKALIKAKSSRARKMPDGKRRAHTPTEVAMGLRRIGAP